MRTIRGLILTLLATTALAACGGQESEPAAPGATTAAEQTASTPYSEAEARMSEAMMAAVGIDAGDNWAKKMVAHHEGATEMSKTVLQQNPTAEVAEMARMTIEKQGKENETIRKLFKQGSPDRASADLYRAAMMDMHQKMQAATGADASETFLRKMLEHHRGAVAISDIALANGVSGALRNQVQKTRSDQAKEIEMVEAMLSGKSMDHSMEATATVTPSPVAPKPPASATAVPKAKTVTATKPEPKATSATTAQPSPSASASCSPEHREAGHC